MVLLQVIFACDDNENTNASTYAVTIGIALVINCVVQICPWRGEQEILLNE